MNLTLAKAALINVTVTAFDQTPLRDIVVQAVRAEAPPREPGQFATPGLADTVLTDVSGKARFLNLRPGKYRVRLHLPDAQLDYHNGEALTVASGQPAEVAFTNAPIHKGQWRRYTSAQGLPSDRVTDLHVAGDGMLWMATAEGVARFDGREFVRFSTEQGLLHNRVFCIQAAFDGALWFGTELGASRFEPATERFQNFPSGKDGLTAGRVIDMEATPDGVLWLRTREGLTRFDGRTFRELPGVPPVSEFDWRDFKNKGLAVDRNGQIWLATTFRGLWRVTGTNVVAFNVKDGLATENNDALQIMADGSLWFQDADARDDSGVTRYDGKRFDHFSVGVYPQPASMVSAIHEMPGGMIWFGHGNGAVTRFNPRNHSLTKFSPGQTEISGMVHQIVHHPDGSLWFATESGIYRYDEKTFAHYTTADGLPKNAIHTSVSSSDGTIWVVGDPSSPETAFTARIKPARADADASPFERFGSEHGLAHPGAFSLVPESDGGMWLSGTPEFPGLYHFDPGAETRSEKPFSVPTGLELFAGEIVRSLHLDKANTMWVGGTVKHLRRFSLRVPDLAWRSVRIGACF